MRPPYQKPEQENSTNINMRISELAHLYSVIILVRTTHLEATMWNWDGGRNQTAYQN